MKWLLQLIASIFAAKQPIINYNLPKPVIMTPPEQPVVTVVPPTPQPAIEPLKWNTVEAARHSVRVICDEMGLSVKDKNDLCGTVGGESGWQSYYLDDVYHGEKLIHRKGDPVIFENKDPKTGKVWSTDWGICQINDHFHIGPGKDFPSAQFVLDHPAACIRWMCKEWKAGNADWWISHKNGTFRRFL